MQPNDLPSDAFAFLGTPDAESLFGELDYRLRSGEHIQAQYRGQEDLFRFLTKWTSELTYYYRYLFGLSLEAEGSMYGSRYYYLTFTEGVKSKVPNRLRQPLKKEFVLIGIFLCKLELDFSKVNTVSGFKRAIREDYEVYKSDFFRLLASVSSSDYLETDEQAVDKKIESAFGEFHRLGWIRLSGDVYETMPSLERLRLLYVNEINNIDELLRHA